MLQEIKNYFQKKEEEKIIRKIFAFITNQDKIQFKKNLEIVKKSNWIFNESAILLGCAITEVQDLFFLKNLLEFPLNPNIPDSYGVFPIHKAAEIGRLDAIQMLIEYSADPNVSDANGVTPLHIANSYNGLGNISEFLISSGANTNARDNLGKRYLM
jgi:ankyrin repeat protein